MLLAVLMAAALTLSACGKKTPVGEAMQNAWAASMEMKSYTFDGSFVIDELQLPSGDRGMALSYFDSLRDLSVSVRGAYVRDPLRMEMILKLKIPGDLAFTIEVPIILTADKMYARIPDIPLLPLGDAAGRFVEFDLAELAESTGEWLPPIDVETQRKLSVDMLNILMRHLDEEDYFRELKKDEVPGLPADLKADRYVRFGITQDNFESFIQALVDHIAPELIDLLLENEAYRSALMLTEDELRQAKDELAANDPDSLRNRLEELKDSLTIHELGITGAIQGDYMVYQAFKGKIEAEENGETTVVGFTFNIRYDNINRDVTFEHDIPSDAMSMEEFGQSLFSGFAF